MTQHFDPPPKKVISQNIRTDGLSTMDKGFIIRMVIAERVRCIMEDADFSSGLEEYIKKFINLPEAYTDEKAIKDFYDSEILIIGTAFKQYEQDNKQYQEDIKAITFYKGNPWRLVSTTFSGTLILIEIKDEKH